MDNTLQLRPLKYENEILKFLDQRLLPNEEVYLTMKSLNDCHQAIVDMVVRGAPLIGFAGIWGLALFVKNNPKLTFEQFESAASFIKSARPTAVNLEFEVNRCVEIAKKETHMNVMHEKLVSFAKEQMQQLYDKNFKMAQIAEAELVNIYGEKKLNILTLCNTGVLACGVLGTALGAIVNLKHKNRLNKVYASETRPYLQGSRLTSFELLKENIEHEIVVEGAASYLMRNNLIDAIFVGADRIVRNGDTANKIGTSSLSIIAKYYKIPFYVVAPISSFDTELSSGEQIEIELRNPDEILKYKESFISHKNAKALNPSFDITTHDCITGIICEKGLINPNQKDHVLKILRDL